jgi:hypothetical protein
MQHTYVGIESHNFILLFINLKAFIRVTMRNEERICMQSSQLKNLR